MKKNIQYAFAIVLIFLSVIGSVWKTEHFENIICAVVIPAFILSIISFVEEIAMKCESDAKKESELYNELSDVLQKHADLDLELYNKGISDMPYIEEHVPARICETQEKSVDALKNSVVAANVRIFCLRLNKVCEYSIIVGYVLLFLSLIMSPHLVELLINVDLNCISLWSLALLYIALELKDEICAKIYKTLYKIYMKHMGKQEDTST